MSDKNVLNASIREKSNISNEEIPAELYGFQIENQSIKLNKINFDKFFQNVGESKIFDLKIDDQEPVKVIVKQIQRDVIKDSIIHVDFYQINNDRKIQVRIPFDFVGESKAVKEMGGLLIKSMEKVLVNCLPGDLLESISVDLSKLDDFSKSYKLFDLDLGDKIEIVSKTNDPIVSVVKPKRLAGPDSESSEDGSEEEVKEESTEEKKEEVKEEKKD